MLKMSTTFLKTRMHPLQWKLCDFAKCFWVNVEYCCGHMGLDGVPGCPPPSRCDASILHTPHSGRFSALLKKTVRNSTICPCHSRNTLNGVHNSGNDSNVQSTISGAKKKRKTVGHTVNQPIGGPRGHQGAQELARLQARTMFQTGP
jgi:hypothetical protein